MIYLTISAVIKLIIISTPINIHSDNENTKHLISKTKT